jgi:hypothetical protein
MVNECLIKKQRKRNMSSGLPYCISPRSVCVCADAADPTIDYNAHFVSFFTGANFPVLFSGGFVAPAAGSGVDLEPKI